MHLRIIAVVALLASPAFAQTGLRIEAESGKPTTVTVDGKPVVMPPEHKPDPNTYDMTQPLLGLDKEPIKDAVSTFDNPGCKKADDFACRKFINLTLGDVCARALWAMIAGDAPYATPGGPPPSMSMSQNTGLTARHNLATRIYGEHDAHLSGTERDAIVKRIKLIPELGVAGFRALQILAPDDPDLQKTVEAP